MEILILEPHAHGHHGPYLEWMATGLAERGFGITIATIPESMEHPSFRALAESNEKMRIAPVSGSPNETSARGGLDSIVREFTYWRFFRKCYKHISADSRPDVVFVPYLDYCLYAIGLLGSPFVNCPWVGLAMRPSFHYQATGVVAPKPALASIKKRLFFRLLRNRNLRHLLSIDESLIEYLDSYAKLQDKVVFFPEPAEFGDLPSRNDAKKHLGVSVERKLILVYGAITGRKGCVELLRAIASPGFPVSVDVVLAGRHASEIHKLFGEPWVAALIDQGRVICLDRFIERTEEPTLFAAADIVWLGYRGHYTSSGVLVQAANAGRPVLACEDGVLGWQTRRHNLGRTVNPRDTAGVISAVIALLDEPTGGRANDRGLSSWRSISFEEAQNVLSKIVGPE